MRKVYGISVLVLATALVVSIIYGVNGATAQLSTVDVKLRETSFGDLATDALCDAANTTISLMAARDFKHGVIEGEITEAKIRSLLAVPDDVWVVSRFADKAGLGAQPRDAAP